MPVGNREHQFLTLVVRDGDDVAHARELEPVVFVPLIGSTAIRGVALAQGVHVRSANAHLHTGEREHDL